MFLERLSVFNEDNYFYKKRGKINYFDSSDIQLPNCTLYCWSRMHEACNWTTVHKDIIRTGGGFPNAKNWIDTTSLPTGRELRAPAIAVFDGNCGHVAFVERVIDSNHALITQSLYDSNKDLRNYKYWEKREVELTVGKATLSGVGKLKGFIYLPDAVDKRVNRDSNKNQIELLEDFVNVRKEPNGELFNKGLYFPIGRYNVLDVQTVADYKWYKLDSECWIREGEWLKELSVDTPIVIEPGADLSGQVAILQAENKALVNTNKQLVTEKENLQKDLNKEKEQVNALSGQVTEAVSKLNLIKEFIKKINELM